MIPTQARRKLPWLLAAAVSLILGCGTSQELSTRSGDVSKLEEALRDSPAASPEFLREEFDILKTYHHDYGEDFERVGGDAAPIMYFFFSEDGAIYRVHPQKGLVTILR